MREYIIDAILILVGTVMAGGGWWLLIHNSDRKLLRNFRPRYENPGLSKDEVVASRSLNLAFFAIIVKLIGSVLVLAGILRLFGV